MTKSLIKNTFREIKNTKARFISIMAIIALGVGFFAGIKATVPSMYNLARTYTDEQELMDYRLVSTVGFDEDDIKAVKNTDGVTSVMPSYFCDVQTDADSGGSTMRVIALPEKYGDNSVQNELVLTEGRLPEKSGEIAADPNSFTAEGYKIGDKIRFAKQTGDTDTSTELKTLEYTVVGLVQSPLYIAYQRGTTTVGNGKISDCFYICPEDFAFERYTELYVKTDISDKFLAYTDDYDNAIEDKATDFEKVGENRSNSFKVEVIDKAKSDLADAKQEYSDNKEKTEKKLADAKTAIDDGKKELKTYREKQNYPSISYRIAEEIRERTGKEVRVTVPGHFQRGGNPSPSDRVLATRFGAAAADLILKEQYGNMVALQNNQIVPVPLAEVAGKLKSVPPNLDLIQYAREIGIGFGD